MDTELLVASLAFIIPMCLTPGPNNVLCAAHGSQHGLRRTLPLIAGMAIGWSTLGLFIGGASVFIEENESFFDVLTYIGAGYIAYLAYKMSTTTPLVEEQQESECLGITSGIFLQVVNSKAWIHFLVLMTAFGSLFGSGFGAKAALVLLNLVFGVPSVIAWAAFGTYLRRVFSTPESSKNLNRAMGLSLFAVAAWIVVPSLTLALW